MLPANTANDPNDASPHRRRGRRGSSSAGPDASDPAMISLDYSRHNRAEAPNRMMKRNRGASLASDDQAESKSEQAANNAAYYYTGGKNLEEESQRKSFILSALHGIDDSKPKLSTESSTRSLDSATDILQQGRVTQLRNERPPTSPDNDTTVPEQPATAQRLQHTTQKSLTSHYQDSLSSGSESDAVLNADNVAIGADESTKKTKTKKKKHSKSAEKSSKKSPKRKEKIKSLAGHDNQNESDLDRPPPLVDFHLDEFMGDLGDMLEEPDTTRAPHHGNVKKLSNKAFKGPKREASDGLSKASTFNDLEAIAHTDYNMQAESGVASLSFDDLFLDSPAGSPLSYLSMPNQKMSNPDGSIVERLASSMPNLDYSHWSSSEEDSPVRGNAGRIGSKASSHFSASSEIFLADEYEDMANLEALLLTSDGRRKVAASDMAFPREESSNRAASKEASSTYDSAKAEILNRFKASARAASRHNPKSGPIGTPGIIRSTEQNSGSSSAGRTTTSVADKLDRGPRKPQRRSDSFEEVPMTETTQMIMSKDEVEEDDKTVVTKNSKAPQEESFHIPATSMAFRRNKDKRWVQTTPGTVEVKRTSTPSSLVMDAMHSSTGQLHQADNTTDDGLTVGVRRSASTGDITELGATSCRWNSEVASKSVLLPKSSRQSDNAEIKRKASASVSMDEISLNNLMPPSQGGKTTNADGRTYLPVSLQSAARRYDRLGQASSLNNSNDIFREDLKPRATDTKDGPASGKSDGNTITVDTGFPEMFEFIDELEEDLIKFENQVASLRERRTRLLEDEGGNDD